MAYRSLPKFDPSARFLVTARLPVLNGVAMKPGDALPPPPAESGPARVYVRLLRQLFDLRKSTMVVEPSAQTNLHYGNIDSLPRKIDEGHDGDELKKGQLDVGRQSTFPNFRRQRDGLIRRDFLSVDPHALGKGYQVGGGVKRRPVASQGEYAVEHRRGGAFAVGSGDMKRGKGFLGMVEERERPIHAV